MKAAEFARVAAALAICALIPMSPARACEGQAIVDFTIHLVDAEAGLQPNKPNPQDIKVASDMGHAYWLQPDALVRNDIVGAEIAAHDDGGGLSHPVVIVRFSPQGQRALAAATAKYVGRELAFVLNGRMTGEPVSVIFPLTGDHVVISGYDQVIARSVAAELMGKRCPRFEPNGAPRP